MADDVTALIDAARDDLVAIRRNTKRLVRALDAASDGLAAIGRLPDVDADQRGTLVRETQDAIIRALKEEG